jgi:hypothetical protein
LGLVSSVTPLIELTNGSAGTDKKSSEIYQDTTGNFVIQTIDEAPAVTRAIFQANRGTGAAVSSVSLGNATDNPSFATLGTGAVSVGGSIAVAGATGGSLGVGTINATALYDDGVQLVNAAGANPSASIGLSAVNGAASTFMRSDAAPALSQAISPTWTGTHTFTKAVSVLADSPVFISTAVPYLTWDATGDGANARYWSARVNGRHWQLQTFNDASGANKSVFDATRGVTSSAISDVSLGNATDNPTYNFLGTGSATFGGSIASGNVSASATAGSLSVNSTTTTNATNLLISRGGVGKGRYGVEGTAGGAINGDAVDDVYVWSTTRFVVSTDSGGAIQQIITPSALTFGSAANPTFTFSGTGATTFGGAVTTNGVLRAIGGAAPLRLNAADSVGDNYIQAYSSDGTTSRWYVGNGGSSDNNLTLNNDATGSTTIQTSSGSVLLSPNATTQVTVSTSGLLMTGATGGAQGSGTVNATNLYINGSAVNAGVQSTATATLTMTNASCTTNNVTVRFVKVGDQVTIRIPALGCATFNGSDKVISASITFPAGMTPAVTQQFATTIYNGNNLSATLRVPTSGSWQWKQNAASGGVALTTGSTGADGAAESTVFTYTLN